MPLQLLKLSKIRNSLFSKDSQTLTILVGFLEGGPARNIHLFLPLLGIVCSLIPAVYPGLISGRVWGRGAQSPHGFSGPSIIHAWWSRRGTITNPFLFASTLSPVASTSCGTSWTTYYRRRDGHHNRRLSVDETLDNFLWLKFIEWSLRSWAAISIPSICTRCYKKINNFKNKRMWVIFASIMFFSCVQSGQT